MGVVTSFSVGAPKVVVTEKDKIILQEKLEKFSKMGNLSTGELMLKIGLDFCGTPYVAKTLDISNEENLIVNLREFDCTTFVENCLAIARTLRSGHPSFDTFAAELEKIRYRSGRLNGYTSRLHYFSEWMTDNAAKGIVLDVTARLGGTKYPVLLSFMSSHPDFYPQLKENPILVKEMRFIENKISTQPFFSIPKEKIAEHESEISEGDIAALTTRIAGLDVTHLGLMFKKEGRIFLLNASLTGGKVEITRMPLSDYLKNSKNTTGIFIIRAI